MNWKSFKHDLASTGLSIRKFAQLVGKDPSAVCHWQHNLRGVPRWVKSWLTLWRRLPQPDRDEVLEDSKKG